MITLYTWTTPNGRKISIALEELGLSYEVKPINIGKNEQFEPEFLAVAPNNKIPAIVDHDAVGGPLSVFESGAILIYLAEKTGKLLAPQGPARYKALEWLNWQMGGLGPMLGQLEVMNRRLAASPYLAGEEYSIADIAAYAWTLSATTVMKDALADSLPSKTHVHAWLKTVGDRPAVQRGMAVPQI